MAANDGFGTLLRNGVEDFPISVESYNQGIVAKASVEPFNMNGAFVSVTSVEPFYMNGFVSKASVEPFNLGGFVTKLSVEPFDMNDATSPSFDEYDLGDGSSVAAPRAP